MSKPVGPESSTRAFGRGSSCQWSAFVVSSYLKLVLLVLLLNTCDGGGRGRERRGESEPKKLKGTL